MAGLSRSKDHNLLASLSVGDVHTQYLLLAGRLGGQTAVGGTASGNNLTLQSTSHATKGKIIFGTSAYDEVNNRLGVGISSPVSAFHIDKGTATLSALQFTANATTGQTLGDGFHVGITATGAGVLNQKENLALTISNNNLPTMVFTANNRAFMGNATLNGLFEVSPAVNLTGAGIASGIACAPSITFNSDGDQFGGIGAFPIVDGTGAPLEVIGGFYVVLCTTSGVGSGSLMGLVITTQYAGSGDFDTVTGASFSCSAGDDTVISLITAGIFEEPNYNEAQKRQALSVKGTWGVDEVENTATGTINALVVETSNYHFINSVTALNGISGGRSGKRLLLWFTAGATINNNSGSAATGNKIFTASGAAITVTGQGCIEAVYSPLMDSGSGGWKVINSQL